MQIPASGSGVAAVSCHSDVPVLYFKMLKSAVHNFPRKCTPAFWLAECLYRFVTNNPICCFQENNIQ